MRNYPRWVMGDLLYVMPTGLGDAIVALVALKFLGNFRPAKSRFIVAAPERYLSFFRALELPVTVWLASDARDEKHSLFEDIAFIVDCSGKAMEWWRAATGKELPTTIELYCNSSFVEFDNSLGDFSLIKLRMTSQGLQELARINSQTGDSMGKQPEPAYCVELRLAYWFLFDMEMGDCSSIAFEKLIWKSGEQIQQVITKQVCICPAGSTSHKKWPARNVIELARRLATRGYGVKILLGPYEQPLVTEPPDELNVILPRDVLELAYEINDSQLVIANDCGPMHIAGALGKPLLAIFGPTNPLIWFCYSGLKQEYLRLGSNDLALNLKTFEPRFMWPTVDNVECEVIKLLEGA